MRNPSITTNTGFKYYYNNRQVTYSLIATSLERTKLLTCHFKRLPALFKKKSIIKIPLN